MELSLLGDEKMPRFFVKNSQINDNKIIICGEDIKHIKNVLRKQIGDDIEICDQDTETSYKCEMAMELAQIYNIDIETAQIAGLLHDNAKEMTDDEMLQYVKENNIQISETERNSVKLLHGKIGADIAKKKYGVSEEIAKAIEYHTTTNPNMDTLAKIIYVSDKIELNRKTEKYDIEAERKLAKEDLDKAMLLIINDVTKYLIEQGKLIAIESIETRNKLLLNIKGEN